jgi:hypothetical protein
VIASASSAPPAAGGGRLADKLGVGLSLLCGLHCLVLPALIGFAPALSLGQAPWIHWVFAFGASGAAVGMLRPQADRLLGRCARGLSALGLILLFSAAAHLAPETAEAAFSVTGGTALALAHLLNARRHRHPLGCRHDPSSDAAEPAAPIGIQRPLGA